MYRAIGVLVTITLSQIQRNNLKDEKDNLAFFKSVQLYSGQIFSNVVLCVLLTYILKAHIQ